MTFSVLSVAAGIAIAGHIGWFLLSSSEHGSALVRKERGAIAAEGKGGACEALPSTAGASGPQGLLEVPVLGLVAPVLQGTSDAVLNEAVGHDPASVWPGRGTSALSAHDVTWFSSIGKLRAGDVMKYVRHVVPHLCLPGHRTSSCPPGPRFTRRPPSGSSSTPVTP